MPAATPVPRRPLPAGLRAPRLAPRRPRRAARTPWPRSAAPSPRASATWSWTCTPARTACRRAPRPDARPHHRRHRADRRCAPRRSWPTVRVRGREPIPRLDEVLTALPGHPDHDRAEVRRRGRRRCSPCWTRTDAWDRVCLGGFDDALAGPGPRGRPGRGCAPRSGRPRRSGCAAGRGWTRCPGPAPRLPCPPVHGDLAQLPRRFGRLTVVDAALLRAAHAARPRGARLDRGRPGRDGRLLDLGVDGLLSTAPTCCASCSTAAAPGHGPPGRRLAGVTQPAGARGQVLAWGLWDWGSSAFNAVILTFVFSVYLTGRGGRRPARRRRAPNSWLGYALGAAGLLLALLAPVIGQRADARRAPQAARSASGRRCVVAMHGGMFFGPGRLPLPVARPGAARPGVDLLRARLGVVQRAAVAGLARRRRSAGCPGSAGRWATSAASSCCSWSTSGSSPATAALLGRAAPPDGLNIRLVALVAAVWFAVFAVPLLVVVPGAAADPDRAPRLGVAGSYRALVARPARAATGPPAHRLLPRGQRAVPGRAGRDLHVRRGARGDRVRDRPGRRAGVRGGRQRRRPRPAR